jgi:hypothetical protein
VAAVAVDAIAPSMTAASASARRKILSSLMTLVGGAPPAGAQPTTPT